MITIGSIKTVRWEIVLFTVLAVWILAGTSLGFILTYQAADPYITLGSITITFNVGQLP